MRVGRYMPFNEITPATNFLCVAALKLILAMQVIGLTNEKRC